MQRSSLFFLIFLGYAVFDNDYCSTSNFYFLASHSVFAMFVTFRFIYLQEKDDSPHLCLYAAGPLKLQTKSCLPLYAYENLIVVTYR